MIFTSLSVIMSVIVSNIHQNVKNCNSIEHRLPKLMRKIFIGFLARIFNMQKDANDLLQTTVSKNKYNTKTKIKNKNNDSDSCTNDPFGSNNDKLFKNIAQNILDIKQEKIKFINLRKINSNLNKQFKNENENTTIMPIWVKRNDIKIEKKFKQTYYNKYNSTDSDNNNIDYENNMHKDIISLSKKRKSQNTTTKIKHIIRQDKNLNYKKNKLNFEYRVKRENLYLYYSYEWNLTALVLVNTFIFIVNLIIIYNKYN